MSERRQREMAIALGEAIAGRRERAGLTQEHVAEMLGIGNQAISRMERGAVIPTVTRLFEFADVYGCRIEDLLRESSDRPMDRAAQLAWLLDGLRSDDQRVLMEAMSLLAEQFKKNSKSKRAAA